MIRRAAPHWPSLTRRCSTREREQDRSPRDPVCTHRWGTFNSVINSHETGAYPRWPGSHAVPQNTVTQRPSKIHVKGKSAARKSGPVVTQLNVPSAFLVAPIRPNYLRSRHAFSSAQTVGLFWWTWVIKIFLSLWILLTYLLACLLACLLAYLLTYLRCLLFRSFPISSGI